MRYREDLGMHKACSKCQVVGLVLLATLAFGVADGRADWQSKFNCSEFTFRGGDVTPYNALSETDKVYMDRYLQTLCRELKQKGKLTPDEMVGYFINMLFRLKSCDENTINIRLASSLKENEPPDAIWNVFSKYCRDTWSSTHNDIKHGAMRERTTWVKAEFFCEASRYMANPGGWRGALRPDDSQIFARLDLQAESLCADLRSGTISYEDAEFRWMQEWLWAKEHWSTEALNILKKSASRFLELMIDNLSK